MRSALLLASLFASLAIATPNAAAQAAQAPVAQAAWTRSAAPLPQVLAPAAVSARRQAETAAPRSPWRYPVIGLVGGAVVGAVAGGVIMGTADEYIGVPAYAFTVPMGALAGLALGGIANLVDRP